eukprot:c5680_g1_i1.p1 GENE.c5680_g1_i1~~c5680_g1_i1.p1  ORF type:complete len:339 (-),score=65.86 c5680_g1_i1:15-1031(-)
MAADVQTLLDHADSLMEQCEFATAHKFLLRALRADPENAVVMEALGEVCVEMGDIENAIKYFTQSIEISPQEGGFARYMYLGQTAQAEEAMGFFMAGIEVMGNALAAMAAGEAVGDEGAVRLALARAYTAAAELYMTDLCEDPEAQIHCERLLGLAMEADPSGFEPLQSLASFRISQCRNDDATAALSQCAAVWQALDADDPRVPSPEFRTTCARLLLELGHVMEAGAVLEALVQDDDSMVEPWYLLGLCLADQSEVAGAAEALLRAQALMEMTGVEEPTLQGDIAQRLEALGAALAEAGESLDDYRPLPEDAEDPADAAFAADGAEAVIAESDDDEQ